MSQVNSNQEKLRSRFVFLDVKQAFDKIWYEDLIVKIRLFLFPDCYQIFESYFDNKQFIVRINNQFSKIYPVRAGVPQRSVLCPFLYNLFTSDFPTCLSTSTATFADHTANSSSDINPTAAPIKSTSILSCGISVNENKSC